MTKIPFFTCVAAAIYLLSGCGATLEIPSFGLQLPSAPTPPLLPVPDIKMDALADKVAAARKVGPMNALRAESSALQSIFSSTPAKDFLSAVETLVPPTARTVYQHRSTQTWLSAGAYKALPNDAKGQFRAEALSADRYYSAGYGSPLTYARVLDVASLHGLRTLDRIRILDFGYGAIGGVHLMAAAGADVVGLDVDTFPRALYSQAGDVGAVPSIPGRRGTLALVHGFFPSDAEVKSQLGGEFDLIISKNRLKKGDLAPAFGRVQYELRSPPIEFLKALTYVLKPGGLVVIYNTGPLQSKDQYIAAADARSPFTQDEIAEAGLKVLAFNQNDDTTLRQITKLLGSVEDAGKAGPDVSALYTVLKK